MKRISWYFYVICVLVVVLSVFGFLLMRNRFLNDKPIDSTTVSKGDSQLIKPSFSLSPLPVKTKPFPISKPFKDKTDIIGAWKELIQAKTERYIILQYLEALEPHQLIRLMEYFCETDRFYLVEGLIMPCLKRKWSEKVPFDWLLELVANKKNNDLFRIALVDIICGSKDKSTLIDRDLIASRLMPIALDQTEEETYREILIKKLSSVLQMGVTDKDSSCDAFFTLLQDPSEQPRVIGASITALRRLGDTRAVPILENKCLDYKVEDNPNITRHAVVALAKYIKKTDIESPSEAIRHVLIQTRDERVYGSSIYALSLLEDKEVIHLLPDVLDSLEMHTSHTARDSVASALMKHKGAIR